jgi:hypothetical protein
MVCTIHIIIYESLYTVSKPALSLEAHSAIFVAGFTPEKTLNVRMSEVY